MKKDDWSSKDFVSHWKYYPAPARPTISELEFIEKKIKEKGKEVKVLILGSTPEYRDMCGNLGIPVSCMDFSRSNYEYLTDEVLNVPKETFIQGNWIDVKTDEKFDIILGDHSIDVVSRKDFHELMHNVSNMLKHGGLFMPRTFIRRKDETMSSKQMIKEYRQKGYIYGIVAGTIRNIFIAACNPKEGTFTFKDLWNLVSVLYKEKLITKQELGYYGDNMGWRIFPEWKFFMPLEEEFEKQALAFYDIIEIFYGTEVYLGDRYPIHVLRKR